MLNTVLGLTPESTAAKADPTAAKADPTAAKADTNPADADKVLKSKKFHYCLRDLDMTCDKTPMFTDYLSK